ncbi:MAG: aminotransferase class V-fold PLP-dependent enzyme [Thermoleophilia bacterium]|nr:aminotransferase class V-fold PLP-dependent enzyme [Thermoleophilia bacterium]
MSDPVNRPIYLDNAASSCPKPPGVIAAVDQCLRDWCANPGRGAHRIAVEAARVIHGTRQKAAKLFNVADSANIIFTQNATDALNMGMRGLLSPGDHVVSTIVEHNAVSRPLKVFTHEGVHVTLVPADATGMVDPGDILAAVKASTKLVVMTHASNITGAIQAIPEISIALKEAGVPLLVDAAQSGGSIPLDMEATPISMLACTGHKSLMGPQGIGLLYISPGVELRSVRQGGTGSHSEEEQDDLARPDRYESGTLNTPGIAGLGAGIDFIQSEGIENLARHKAELTAILHQGLDDISRVKVYGPPLGAPRGPLVSFNVGEMPASDVSGILDRRFNIASRAGIHCAPGSHQVMGTLGRGAVRLSIGPFNTPEDITTAVAAVEKIASGVS